ncbi:MAG TPA: PDZ domain-containing protein [Tepidisphaeraceae bacterium]
MTKAAVPTAAVQLESGKLVREIYGSDIAAAKTPADKSAVVRKLIQAGIDESADFNGRYMLFVTAKETATEAGDWALAWNVVDATALYFQIDALAQKVDLAMTAAKSPRTDRKAFSRAADELTASLLQADRHALARQTADLALAAARTTADPALIRQMTARIQEVTDTEAAFADVKQAIVTLETSPSDPGANFKLGRFRCFIRGDWDAGLPMLALGSDVVLKALAAKELAAEASPEEQLKVADGWWDIAEKESAIAKTQIRSHAARGYQKNVANLAGLAKAKAEKRIKEAGPLVAAVSQKVNPPEAEKPAKPINKAIEQVFDLRSEKGLNDQWTFTAPWRIENGLRITEKGKIESKQVYGGDVSLSMAFTMGGFHRIKLVLWGEPIDLQNEGSHVLTVVKKGTTLSYGVDGKTTSTIQLKQAQAEQPTSIGLRFDDNTSNPTAWTITRMAVMATTVAAAEVPAGLRSDGGPAVPRTGVVFRSIEIHVDEQGKGRFVVDTRPEPAKAPAAAKPDGPKIADLGAARVDLLPDGKANIVLDFSKIESLDALAGWHQKENLRLDSSRLLMLANQAQNKGTAAHFYCPRVFNLPFQSKTSLTHDQFAMMVLGLNVGPTTYNLRLIGDSGEVVLMKFSEQSKGEVVKQFVMTKNAVRQEEFSVDLTGEKNMVKFRLLGATTNAPAPIYVSRIAIESKLRARIGVSLEGASDGRPLVKGLLEGPAARAGMKIGDIITAINGQSVNSHLDCMTKIGDLPIGQPATISLDRGGTPMEMKIAPE